MRSRESRNSRHAAFAGSWYPGDRPALEALIGQALEGVRSPKSGPAPSLAVLPHAGLFFSARGIAAFFSWLGAEVERIIILAPSHYVPLAGDMLTTADFSAYGTPLGSIPGSPLPLGSDVAASGTGSDRAVQQEHAVEMVLPFIAYANERRKKPIEVSSALVSHVSSASSARGLAGALVEAVGRENLDAGRTVIIGSSDFTHYGRRFAYIPFGDSITDDVLFKVKEQDMELARLLSANRTEDALAFSRRTRCTVCGIAGALIVSAVAGMLGAQGVLADYYTSADVPGGGEDFVAYASIIWR